MTSLSLPPVVLIGAVLSFTPFAQYHPGPLAAADGLAVLALAQEKPAPTCLDAAIKKMDIAAANFTSAQAEIEQDRYEKVIDEIDDVQKGTIYYRRTGSNIEMKLDITTAGDSPTTLKPEPKHVLFANGKIRLYLPVPDQETDYDLGKNNSDFESYLVLGFGGSGQDLLKAFDVTCLGEETLDGIATAKLKLVPKSQRVRNNFTSIVLWIDLDRGISVRQQFFDPQGDYRLAKYSAIRLNQKIHNDVFQIKTTSKTQVISPHG
jgi:outer membrane lipoprotein-sorting protein